MKTNMRWLLATMFLLAGGAGVASAATPGDYPAMIGVYTDSTPDNTWPTDAAAYPNLEDWYSTTSGVGPIWWDRTITSTTVLLEDDIMEAFAWDAYPPITMTVGGLDAGKIYDVYVVYWSKVTATDHFGAWSALPGETPAMWDNRSATNIAALGADISSSVDICQGLLGQVSGSTSVSIDVYSPVVAFANDVAVDRVWFEGLTVQETTTVRPTRTLTLDIQIEDPNNFMTGTYTDADFDVTPGAGVHSYISGQNATLIARESNPCPDRFAFSHWIDVGGVITYTDYPIATITMDQDVLVTAVYKAIEYDKVCGDLCHPISPYDLTQDCLIDMDDFTLLVADWLTCTQPACD